jgi:predicted enzyme related to lactoylglutathione lyase
MTDPRHRHHAINYIEFTVLDMVEAKRFYGEAFGWQFTDYGPEYAGIQGRSAMEEVGGFRLDATITAGGPLVILYSSDLNLTRGRVEVAGGVVTQGPYDFPGGRRFHFHDPSGNELAVWSEA